MAIATGPYEITDLKITLLGDHVREEGVLGDVEDQPDGHIGAALEEKAGEFSIGHAELEQGVARGQGGAAFEDVRLRADALIGQHSGVPSGNDVTARVGLGFDLPNDLGDLVNSTAVSGGPGTPLSTVDGTEITGLGSPGIPDVHIVIEEALNVGRPASPCSRFTDRLISQRSIS